MKLYQNTTRQIARKKIGKYWWPKLSYAAKLKPGDLISTCKGYNERIKEITPEWTSYGLSKGRVISDFRVETESGSACSLFHCCTIPTESKATIIQYWNFNNTPEGKKFKEEQEKNGGWTWPTLIPDALLAGKEVFDDDGQLLYEYAPDYEQKARFPERWAAENMKE